MSGHVGKNQGYLRPPPGFCRENGKVNSEFAISKQKFSHKILTNAVNWDGYINFLSLGFCT